MRSDLWRVKRPYFMANLLRRRTENLTRARNKDWYEGVYGRGIGNRRLTNDLTVSGHSEQHDPIHLGPFG